MAGPSRSIRSWSGSVDTEVVDIVTDGTSTPAWALPCPCCRDDSVSSGQYWSGSVPVLHGKWPALSITSSRRPSGQPVVDVPSSHRSDRIQLAHAAQRGT